MSSVFLLNERPVLERRFGPANCCNVSGNGTLHFSSTYVATTGCLYRQSGYRTGPPHGFRLNHMNVDRTINRGIDSQLFGQLPYDTA